MKFIFQIIFVLSFAVTTSHMNSHIKYINKCHGVKANKNTSEIFNIIIAQCFTKNKISNDWFPMISSHSLTYHTLSVKTRS